MVSNSPNTREEPTSGTTRKWAQAHSDGHSQCALSRPAPTLANGSRSRARMESPGQPPAIARQRGFGCDPRRAGTLPTSPDSRSSEPPQSRDELEPGTPGSQGRESGRPTRPHLARGTSEGRRGPISGGVSPTGLAGDARPSPSTTGGPCPATPQTPPGSELQGHPPRATGARCGDPR